MGKNIKWSKELIIEIASAFSTRNEFATKNRMVNNLPAAIT